MPNADKSEFVLPPTPQRVLVVDDEPDIRALFSKKLTQSGFQADSVDTVKDALLLVKERHYDAVLLDLFLGEHNSLDSIPDFFSIAPSTKIVILTGHGSIDYAVNAMNKGATGFLVKTDPPDTNIAKIRSLMQPEQACPPGSESDLSELGIIGRSKAMQGLSQKLRKLKGVDSTVLLEGESGTGKELFARAIHKLSNRGDGPFIAINCAAISESILESELFGYKRGAFTDAKKDRKGYFETCSEGTLFLDEIGEMPQSLQSKLLRVLQEKEVTPLGSCSPVAINTRIIGATNRNLRDDVASKRFREDLYYRLAVFQISLPSLRERKDDIPLLAEHFIRQFNQHFEKNVTLPPNGLYSRLKAYDWPGNIRELQNAIERAVVLSNNGEFSAEDLLPYREIAEATEKGAPRLSDLPLNFQTAKDSFENFYINNLLSMTNGNVTEAARVSGQYRPNVYRLINKFQIDPSQFKQGHHP